MGAQIGKAFDSLKKLESELDNQEPLEDPPVPPPPDPRLPLTAKQLFNISKSWKGIARAMEPTGITMFVKLFEENEDILHLFQKFQTSRLNDWQKESLELAQHASIVMCTLDESIKTLNDVDHFQNHLHSVGKLHRKIPGFQRDYFWRIERPFLAAVQDTLGERYTENMENIYKITIRYVLNTVVKGFDLGEIQPNACNSNDPSQTAQPSSSISSNIQSKELGQSVKCAFENSTISSMTATSNVALEHSNLLNTTTKDSSTITTESVFSDVSFSQNPS